MKWFVIILLIVFVSIIVIEIWYNSRKQEIEDFDELRNLDKDRR